MSAPEIGEIILNRLAAEDCEDFILVNFANGDMVGHTGVLAAAITAVETVDTWVGRIAEVALARGGALIVTADHGNAEQMFDPTTNAPHTAHTTFDVQCIVVDADNQNAKLREGGRLADIMPTALDLMGLDVPGEMTGRSLLRVNNA
jgi:2,3-bisphosphoglycerate-independent phosphoglycerate mutase